MFAQLYSYIDIYECILLLIHTHIFINLKNHDEIKFGIPTGHELHWKF